MPLPPLSSTLRQQISLPLDSKDLVIPHFAALYRYLTAEVLEPSDGSSSAKNREHEQEGTELEVKDLWIQKARNNILIKALREVCLNSGVGENGHELSTSMRELGLIIAAYLSYEHGSDGDGDGAGAGAARTLHASQLEALLKNDVEDFRDGLDDMSRVVGHHIIENDRTIRDMLELIPTESDSSASTTNIERSSRIPTTTSGINNNPSTIGRRYQPTQNSSTTSADLLDRQIKQHNKTVTEILPNLLTKLTSTMQELQSTQTELLTTQIKHLETYTHSTQSRNLSTHAQFLATVSKGIATKAQVLALLKEKEIYAQPGITESLALYHKSLSQEEADLARQERELESLLAEYSSFQGGETTFRTLGVEYARVEAEIETVKLDIERLQTTRDPKSSKNGK